VVRPHTRSDPTSVGEVIADSPELNGLKELAARRRSSVRVRTFQEMLMDDFHVVAGRVSGLLPAEGLCLLLGADKTGKSLINILIALCVAAGVRFLGRDTQPCPVLLIEEEGSLEALQTRLRRVAAGRGLSEHDLPLYVIHRSRWRLDDPAHVAELQSFITNHGVGLVVMGPLAQLADVDDENRASGFNVVARNILDVAADTHTLFVLAHHRRKPDPKAARNLTVRQFFDTSRGTNALTAAMDVGLGLDRDPESEIGELLVLARDDAPSRIRLHFDSDHLTFDVDERPQPNPVRTDLDRLMAALREDGSISAKEASERIGASVNTAKARLERLVYEGLVEVRETPGRATVWVPRAGPT
jgi:sugar phosphate isomerase/epimerase